MKGRIHPEKITITLSVFLLVLFCAFVLYWEKHQLSSDKQDLTNNGQVITSALWNLDPHGPIAYLKLAAKHQTLERITVYAVTNKVFLEVDGPKRGFFEMTLESIGLIPKIKLQADVIHKGMVIGKIVAIHRHTTIYLYFYILLVSGLILLTTRLYMRIVEAKNILEDGVAARTQELVTANIGLKQEIHDRTRAEVALRNNEEKYREIFNAPSDAILIHDAATGSILDVNQASLELYGYPYEELLKENIGSLSAGESPYDMEHGAQKVIKAMTEGPQLFEWRVKKQNGELVWVEVGLRFTEFSNQKYVIAVVRNIDERKGAEKALAKVRKLESVGILAGGIAHDFNNILAAILGNINLALLRTEPEDKNYGLLQEAEKASLRARDLTQQLLTFAKGGDPIKELSHIKDVIQDSANFVLRGSNVRCNFSCEDGLWPVEIDLGQMSQVVQNIIINAHQAMPEGGVIEVNCSNISCDESRKLTFISHDCIKVTIQDSGIGMPHSVVDKIFDPYFTTKQKGSGLGLAVSHSIISKHGGYITASSEPGVGTTFTLYLPAEKDQQPVLAEEQVVSDEQASQGRILIMDDEEMLREVSNKMLAHLGYDVLLAADGKEAITLFKDSLTSNEPIDLIIMDLTIPGGMGGRKAVQEVHKIDPAAKVVVASGYSNDPIMANYRDYGFVAAIVKPFQLQELKSTVQSIL